MYVSSENDGEVERVNAPSAKGASQVGKLCAVVPRFRRKDGRFFRVVGKETDVKRRCAKQSFKK